MNYFDRRDAVSGDWNSIYFDLNTYMYNSRNVFESDSRNGKVRKVYDFRTKLTNPYRRCTGGNGRDINIFFLLAEAIWIVCGKRDVNFISQFNERIRLYSDNGMTFHAPYGYRMRHWGESSDNVFENGIGEDQLWRVVNELNERPDSRRAVISIWNPNLDTLVSTKDIPCNDMVMFKTVDVTKTDHSVDMYRSFHKDRALITTVQNRSNDLNLGLPTNVFQFSFLSEIISLCLNMELYTQTHNSQDLHVYLPEDESDFYNKFVKMPDDGETLYQTKFYEPIDFKFNSNDATFRLREITDVLEMIIKMDNYFIPYIYEKSKYLSYVAELLLIYQQYKMNKKDNSVREFMIKKIDQKAHDCGYGRVDITALAKNYFYTRLNNKEEHIILY